jgi:hypothetical protein
MRSRTLLLISAVFMLLAAAIPASANSDTVDRYYRLQAAGVVTLTPDGRTQVNDIAGAEVVVNAMGEVVDRLPFRARSTNPPLEPGMAKMPCVNDTTQDGFTPYLPPVTYLIDKKNEKGSFKFHFYSQDNARLNQTGQPTVQFLSCAARGVDADGGSRITISGPGVAFNDAETPRILGQSWKEGETPEDYSITLGFQAPVRPVSVTGSIQQHPSNSLKGSVVPPYDYEDMKEYHENAVNAWWEDHCRPRCTRLGGSNQYQGSVAEGLWEFPQWYKDEVLRRGFKHAGYLEHFCSNPFGC